MDILILYFSGTGNTHYIAKQIKDSLQNENAKCSAVETLPPERIKNYDTLIFGFPIYACKMPEFLKQFTDKFPLTKSKRIVLFSTFAYTPCNAMKDATNYFEKRGFRVVFAKGVKMPGSDGLLLLKKGSHAAKKASQVNFKSIEQFVNDVKYATYSNSAEKAQSNFLFTPFGLVAKLFIPIENPLKRAMFADEKCIHCGICEKVCPTNNIKVTESEVLFGNECVLCLRCVSQCPVEAIQIGKFTKGTVRWRGPSNDYNPLENKC